MHYLPILLLVAGQVEVVASKSYPRELQLSAVCATVRVVNVSEGTSGSGAILGRKGAFVYILTANHLVHKADRLEVSTFVVGSYPKPKNVYRSAELVAGTDDLKDLALIRVTTEDDVPGSLKLCPAESLPQKNGFEALAVGCTDGGPPTCLIDKVIGKKLVRREAGGKTAWFWELDRKYAEGRSGGPLLDSRGSLLGILSGTSGGHSFFAHIEEIRAFLEPHGFK
jgi:S1-C subfamily serine protease